MKNVLSVFAAIVIALGFAGSAFAAQAPSENPQAVQVMEKVSINDADAETLASLHRVGEKKAAAIIEWRETNGDFTSIEQLIDVKGIGEATLAANRDRVSL